GLIACAQAVGTIVNDDPVPSICVDDVQVVEGNSGTTEARFTVRLSAASGQPVSVDYATADGTALSGSDYVAASGTLVFAPAGGSVPPQAPVLSVERSGTQVRVSWTSSWNGFELQAIDLLGGGSGWTTVPNAPVVSGDRYSVTLAAASGSEFYRLVAGQGSSAGETSKVVVVPVKGELLNEPDETFLLKLSNASNGLIACAQAVGTIVNDDAAPVLAINDVSVVEGNSGTTNAVLTVSLSAATAQTVTVNYATANGTATAGTDYVSTNGTLTFLPGQTSQTITVTVFGDALDELDETILVNLTAATNATIADGQGVVTIVDDDAAPVLAINDVSVVEGNSGTTNAVLTVSLSAASAQTVTVNYATANGTATAGTDYVSTNSTLTFLPGQTSQTITVTVLGDALDELDETILVNLTAATNATISDGQGVVTILDDDDAPVLSINDLTVVESNSGTTNAVLTVSLSSAAVQTVTVNYATANGTALAGTDYVSTNGTLTFLPGQTSQTITVKVLGDVLDELDETILVNLTAATNATIADGQGVVTIVDDDAAPVLAINDVSVV